MKRIFITGTDTGVGKTIVSAWLCKHWQAAYFKPIQSGLEGETDSQWVHTLSDALIYPETHRLKLPLSPHQAAAADHITIKLSDFVLPDTDRLVIEGAGGCLVPLNWRERIIDLIAHLNVCTLVVARSGLGTINHTTLTLQALKNVGIPVLGVVLVGDQNTANKEAIEHFGEVPVLAELPILNPLNPQTLANHVLPERLFKALESL